MSTKSEGVNPNAEVGAEANSSPSAGSIMSFDELDELTSVAEEKPKASGKVAEKKDKPKKRDEGEADADVDDDDGEGGKKPAKEGKAAADDKAKPDTQADKAGANAKPKSHKGRSGESEVVVPSNTVFSVPVAGKKEEASLQDLLDSYSGKQNLHREHNNLAREKKTFNDGQKALTERITKLYDASKSDPEEAFDLLADLSGKDAIELKEGVLRSQYKQVLDELARRGLKIDGIEQVIESIVNDAKLGWRERKITRGEKKVENESKQREETEKLATLKTRYGVDDESYERHSEMVATFIEKNGLKESVTPELVIKSQRGELAWNTIHEVVPHLAQKSEFGQILGEITEDLVKHPEITAEQLRATLTEIWGEDAERKARLARKAQERASSDDAPPPRKKTDGKSFSNPMELFDLD